MPTATQQNVINSRLFAALCLGFSSGLPLALTSSTLQAWFTESGINLLTIGFISLVGLPYVFKFLWAPLMDYFSIPRLGRRRGWVLLTQFGVALSLLALGSMQPDKQTQAMIGVALLVAFLAASQDISVDAYRTDLLQENERGLGAAYFVFAFRMAALVSGGLALLCAQYLGWKMTYQIMAFMMLLSMLTVYIAPAVIEHKPLPNLFQNVQAALQDLLQRHNIVIVLLFICLYKFGCALAMSLNTTFLLRGLGFSLAEVGVVSKSVIFFAVVLGAFTGGILLTRWNLYRGLLVFGILQAVAILGFALLAMSHQAMLVDSAQKFLLMGLVLFLENFFSGMGTAAFFAFLMSLCQQRYSATQYALFSALDALPRVVLGPLAAILVKQVGWTEFYVWAFLFSFPGLILLVFLKQKVFYGEHATAN